MIKYSKRMEQIIDEIDDLRYRIDELELEFQDELAKVELI